MKKHKTLIISKKEAQKLVTMKMAIEAVEKAFREYGRGKVQMPAKIYLNLEKFHGDFRAMPAFIDSFELCTLKWVNAHPQNKQFGLPAVMAVIILSDPKNGFPLAIMDGTFATSLRTGAGAAVAAKYLARKNSQAVGLVGCGAQARTQLLALREVFKLKEVKVYDQNAAAAKKFILAMKKPDEKMILANSIKDCVTDCDMIATITPSRKPIIRLGWIKNGMHVNAIGADAQGKEELDPKILKRSKVVIDDWQQASHSGEINVPVSRGLITKRDIYATLGEIVAGRKRGRTSKTEITIFDSTGLAIQDVAVASLIYREAVKKRAGRFIEIV